MESQEVSVHQGINATERREGQTEKAGRPWRLATIFALVLAAMGILMVVLALLSGEFYHRQTLDRYQRHLTHILHVETALKTERLSRGLRDLAVRTAFEPFWHAALKSRDVDALRVMLTQRFAGLPERSSNVPLRSIELFDATMAPLLQMALSNDGAFAGACVDSLGSALTVRELTYDAIRETRCSRGGSLIESLLVPVGSDETLGFIALSADLSATLRQLEEELLTPLHIVGADGTTLFQSPSWPEPSAEHLYIQTPIADGGGDALATVVAAHNAGELITERYVSAVTILGYVATITLGCAIFMLFVLRRVVVNPLGRLTAHLSALRQDRSLLGKPVAVSGNGEVRQLIHGFNAMSREMAQLYRELSASNRELENEVRVRRGIELQMKRTRDEALESAKIKSQFVANISHEIRTPISGILGMLELLADTDLSVDQYDYIAMARRSGETLLNIINDLLDLSKLEAGRLSLEQVEVDLNKLVKNVIELFADRAKARGLVLNSEFSNDVPTTFNGDPTRLQQILINLIGNALKFTDKGFVALRIEVLDRSPEHEILRFEVKDTGIGILRDKQETIFETFMQADGSTTRQYGGTGLGLAIVKQLAQLMDGQVGVESESGKGSSFWFTAKVGRRDVAPLCFLRRRVKPPRLLIADEENVGGGTIRQILDAWGVRYDQVTRADALYEAVAGAERAGEPFDMLFLSTTFPEYLDIATTLRRLPHGQALGIIALRPVGEYGIDPRWEKAGIGIYATKPLHQEQIYECITAILGEPFQPPLRATSATPPSNAARAELRVLVAEDNLVNQKVAVGLLKKLNVAVDIAEDGLQTVSKWRQQHYDLILMDCQMPVLDGYDAAREIRRLEVLDPGRGRVPIVAMTAHNLDVAGERCRQSGMDDFLSKPVKRATLQTALKQWLPAAGSVVATAEKPPGVVEVD